ncbi:MAG: sulfotransferase [Calditrichae bacterium]|nr:sulfotransferase [Calditrichota bacterium]MCB9057390.1 sulfotransferase [Calditrichia bacterium]
MKQNKLARILNPLIIKLGRRIEKRQFSGIPIVIGACPRSGTTILLSILGAHPDIFAIPNQTYTFDRWEEYRKNGSDTIHYKPVRMDRLYREFLYNRVPKGPSRWLEKTPKHLISFHKILDYMGENVQLIHVIRDGRDVVTSKHPRHNPDEYWVPVERWVKEVEYGLSFEGHPQVLNVRYEDFVLEFEKTMHKVYAFLNEPVPNDLDHWIERTNVKKSKHWDSPVQNLYSKSIARWKKPEHAKRIEEFMANEQAVALLERLGYGSYPPVSPLAKGGLKGV